MLRAAVVLALVAVALAQTSPFVNEGVTSPFFSNAGDQVRFVPRPGNVLAVSAPNANNLKINGATPYRVVSVRGTDNPQSQAPNRLYFGNVGQERFQSINGNGQAAAGDLILGLDTTGRDRVIRDARQQANQREVSTASSLAVPTFERKVRPLPLNANDIVIARKATNLFIPTGFSNIASSPSTVRYFVINNFDVAGIYSAGLRLNGDNYAQHFAGTTSGTL
jgi:hypothetical protein